MQNKLTLRLEEDLIIRAKSYAKKSGKSVSRMVADYLALLDDYHEENDRDLTPLVRSLKGSLREANVDREDYRHHLEEKYL